MAIQEGGDQVGLVAIGVGKVALAGVIAEQSFRDFGICVGGQALPDHGWSDGHVEQLQPAVHLAQGFAQVGVGLMNGLVFQSGMNGQLPLEIVTEQLLVKAAHVRQDGQLPFGIFAHTYSFGKPGPAIVCK